MLRVKGTRLLALIRWMRQARNRRKTSARSLTSTSLPRTLGLLVFALSIVLAGTWAAVKIGTDHLLYQDATATARNWGRLLAESVTDLEQIAAGEAPASGSMKFFEWAQKAGNVYRYEIYNREGYSQLISDRGIAVVNLSQYSPDAVRSMATREPVVDARESTKPGEPTYFAQAYVPVILNGRPIAIVAAYVDQTEKRDQLYQAFLTASVSLCLLTGIAFAVPAIGWYQRTKDKQRADRRIRYLAHHDSLTGLSNRASLVEKLDSAVGARARTESQLAVLFIDIDRFKEVNDVFGHDGGDFLLRTVGTRLHEVTRLGDIVARLGGDEFVLVMNDIEGKEQAEELAGRIANSLSAPIHFNENTLTSTVSVGIALAPEDGSNAERLLKSADLALYRAKADGRNCVRFFHPDMDAVLAQRIKLERTIRNAALKNGFVLHYQPVFEMSGRQLVGFEALIRLPAADGSLIPPAVFIPVAEDLRLIDKIGAWVLNEACSVAATWPEDLTIAVNLSPLQFGTDRISGIVAGALKAAGLAPHRLELEITETLLLGDSAAVLKELQALKTMGVRVVMDDFGTGYSSLSYLWRFPFDKIKIDRSFMTGFDGSGRDVQTVVKTIIALGRELNMRVTVEGVETSKQVAFLDNADADQVQGFYFGRPLPVADVAAKILTSFREQPGNNVEPAAREAVA